MTGLRLLGGVARRNYVKLLSMTNHQNTDAPFESRIKRLLSAGKAAWGIAALDESEFSAKLAINCDPDFFWIDLEHRPYGFNEVRWLPILCRQVGVAALIRVPGLDPVDIKKALDIGASAIMIPQIGTADEAKRAVEYAKYPPQGSRGITPTWTTYMDVSWDDYLPVANDETCVVVQIESSEGIANMDAIAAVEGVDVVFAGPADLSAALGVIGQTQHPKVLDFLASFPQRVGVHGKVAGITMQKLEHVRRSYDEGYRFINTGWFPDVGSGDLTSALETLRDYEHPS